MYSAIGSFALGFVCVRGYHVFFLCVDCVCAKMFLMKTRRYFEQFADSLGEIGLHIC